MAMILLLAFKIGIRLQVREETTLGVRSEALASSDRALIFPNFLTLIKSLFKMRRLMNLIILATLSLIFVLGWYGWSMGGVREMQTWPYGSNLIAISPNGKLLASPDGPYQERKIGNLNLTEKTTVKLHSFPDGEVVRTLDAFYITSLAFSPDSSLIAAGDGLGRIFIWRTDDGQLLHTLRVTRLEPQAPRVNTLIFSKDGQTLITGVVGGTDAWRVADGQLLYSLSHQFNGYGYNRHCDISPDSQILALSGGTDGRIALYRLGDGTLLRELESDGRPKFSPNGQLLAIDILGGYEQSPWQQFGLYRLSDDTLLGPLVLWFDGSLLDYGFSPDGRYLAATYRTGGGGPGIMPAPDFSPPDRWHLVLWRIDNLSSKYFFPRTIQSRQKRLTALAFSPDGKILVSGGDAIRLWRMPD